MADGTKNRAESLEMEITDLQCLSGDDVQSGNRLPPALSHSHMNPTHIRSKLQEQQESSLARN